ncbi:hypothetical protein LGK97_16060 [Clostridium sp. CS001]|uniref:hypothetical protein n=1 Tax=Clostridium sp. CS001 TaxID=2880648 RepID=UPI001CF1804B|nr:hypothetical protein [Clostridium sp. CS001]MCB2291243.1 hypothetical protein [Clostridium sp. CS001]
MVKKILSSILVLVMAGSLVACGSSKEEVKNDAPVKQEEPAKTEAPKEEIKFESIGQILDSAAQKDEYYSDKYNLKILKKDAIAAYEEKAAAVTQKAMADNKIDAKSSKVYPYYNNISGVRFEKDYIVVYDANKVPVAVHELIIAVSDKDEPSFKEVKENKEMITDEFKALFPQEIEAK